MTTPQPPVNQPQQPPPPPQQTPKRYPRQRAGLGKQTQDRKQQMGYTEQQQYYQNLNPVAQGTFREFRKTPDVRAQEQLGYVPTWGQDPREVAKAYQQIKATPKGQPLPPHLEGQQEIISEAYNYYQSANKGRPDNEWNYLRPEDPALPYFASIQGPPEDKPSVFAQDEAVKKGFAQWEEIDPGQRASLLADPNFDVSQYPVAIRDQIYRDPNFDWSRVPKWQKLTYDITSNPKIMASPMALAGFRAGGILGLPGKIAGAILGYGLGVVGGQEYDPTGGVFDQPTFVAKAMAVLNKLSEGAEQTIGYTAQVSEAAIAGMQGNEQAAEAARKMLFDEQYRQATWQAGRFTYEASDFLGARNWIPAIAYLFATDDERKRIEFAEKGEDFILGIAAPVDRSKAFGINPITGNRVQVTDSMGILQEARLTIHDAIKRGASEEEVRQVIRDMLMEQSQYVGAMVADFAGQMVIDPLEIMPEVTNKASAKLARLMGNETAARSFESTRSLTQAGQMYRTLVQSGDVAAGFDYQNMGSFARWVAGVNEQGQIKAGPFTQKGLLDPATPQVRQGILDRMKNDWTALTPEARAREGASMFFDNMGVILSTFDDPADVTKFFRAVAAGDMGLWSEMAGKVANSPEWYTILPALKDFDAGEIDNLVTRWEAGQAKRDTLLKISSVLGEEPGKLIDDLAKRGTAEQDFNRIVNTLRNSKSPQAKQLLEAIARGEFTSTHLQDIVTAFTGDAALPWHPAQWRAEFLDALGTHFDEWTSNKLGLADDPAAHSRFFRTTHLLKSAQSILLLGLSPGYAITNGLSNMVHRAATGIYGYLSPHQINDWLTKFGITPARLDEGFGIGGMIETAETPGTIKVEQIQGALRSDDTLARAQDMVSAIARKMPFNKLSGAFEKMEGRQGFMIAMRQFWSQSWRRGVGFKKMDSGLVSTLQGIGVNPEIIYSAIEAGMKQGDIERAIFGRQQGLQARSLVNEAAVRSGMSSADAAEMLEKIGVLDVLDNYLKGADTADKVRSSFNRAIRRAQEQIDITASGDAISRAEQIANRVSIEGAKALTDIVTDVEMQGIEKWLQHYQRMGNAALQMDTAADPSLRKMIWQEAYTESNQEFRRYNALRGSTYLGIVKSIGLEDNPHARGFLRNIADIDTTMDEAYRFMRDQRNSHYEKWSDNWDDPAQYKERDAVEKSIDRKFKDAMKKEQAYLKQMGDLLGRQYETLYGIEAGEAARQSWDTITRFRNEMVKRQQAFRDQQRQAYEMGVSYADRQKASQEFWGETYKYMIVEMAKVKQDAIAKLDALTRGDRTPPQGGQPAPEGPQAPPQGEPIAVEMDVLRQQAELRRQEAQQKINSIWDIAEQYSKARPGDSGNFKRENFQDKFNLLGSLKKAEYGGDPTIKDLADAAEKLSPEKVQEIFETRKRVKAETIAAENAARDARIAQARADAIERASKWKKPENINILTAIKRAGGIDYSVKDVRLDVTGNDKAQGWMPGVFTRKGAQRWSIDQMARIMAEEGKYPINLDDPTDPGGVNQLIALMQKQNSGQDVFPVTHDFAIEAEAAQAEQLARAGIEAEIAVEKPSNSVDLWEAKVQQAIAAQDLNAMTELMEIMPVEGDKLRAKGETYNQYLGRVWDEVSAEITRTEEQLAIAENITRAQLAMEEAHRAAEKATTREILEQKYRDAFPQATADQISQWMEMSDIVLSTLGKITGDSVDTLYSRYKDIIRDGDYLGNRYLAQDTTIRSSVITRSMTDAEIRNYTRALVRAGADELRRAIMNEPNKADRRAIISEAHKLDAGLAEDVARRLPREVLFQPAKGGVQFLDGGHVIMAFEGGDISTIVHENGHIFLEMMSDAANRTGNIELLDNLATFKDWARLEKSGDTWTAVNGMGNHSIKQIGVEFYYRGPSGQERVFDTFGDAQYTLEQEMFARGFERYLAEGSAPTPRLKAMFDNFKTWLVSIYESITGSHIDVNLTDNMRRVFDRMLGEERAREQEIQQVIAGRADQRTPAYDNLRDIWGSLDKYERNEAMSWILTKTMTDPLSGLETLIAKEVSGSKPVGWVDATTDLNALKFINDTLGHQAGDAVIRELGTIAKEEAAKVGGRAFRVGGDENAYWFPSEEAAKTALEAMDKRLFEAEIEIEGVKRKGFSISYGYGDDFHAADAMLYIDKEKRLTLGQRAERGVRPPSIVDIATENTLPKSDLLVIDRAPGDVIEVTTDSLVMYDGKLKRVEKDFGTGMIRIEDIDKDANGYATGQVKVHKSHVQKPTADQIIRLRPPTAGETLKLEGQTGRYEAGKFYTISGREVEIPRLRTETGKKLKIDLAKVDQWLVDEAKVEAELRGDTWNGEQFDRMNAAKLTPAERTGLNEYLFGVYDAADLIKPEGYTTRVDVEKAGLVETPAQPVAVEIVQRYPGGEGLEVRVVKQAYGEGYIASFFDTEANEAVTNLLFRGPDALERATKQAERWATDALPKAEPTPTAPVESTFAPIEEVLRDIQTRQPSAFEDVTPPGYGPEPTQPIAQEVVHVFPEPEAKQESYKDTSPEFDKRLDENLVKVREGLTDDTPSAAPDPTPVSRETNLLNALVERLDRNEWFEKSRDFETYIKQLGFDIEKEADLNLAYDLMEGAYNMKARKIRKFLDETNAPLSERLAAMDRLETNLTEARRTLGKMKLQQFSTPLTISEAAGYVADVKPGDIVGEPTAGTGNLVDRFMVMDGVRVKVNEIDPGRRDVLSQIGYEPTGMNLMGADWVIENGKKAGPWADVVISNPPWGSYSTGKYGKPVHTPVKLNDWSQRFAYLTLMRMPDGGRYVGVMPTNWLYTMDRATRKITNKPSEFYKWLQKNYTVHAVIESPPDAYKARATDIGSLLVVIDKTPHIFDVPTIERYGDNAPKSWDEYATIVESVPKRTQEAVQNGRTQIEKTEVAGPDRSGIVDPAARAGKLTADVENIGRPVAVPPTRPVAGGGDITTGEGLETRLPDQGDAGDVSQLATEGRNNIPSVVERKPPVVQGEDEQLTYSDAFQARIIAGREAVKNSGSFAEYVGRAPLRPDDVIHPHPNTVVETKGLSGVPYPPLEDAYRPSPSIMRAMKRRGLSYDGNVDPIWAAIQQNDKHNMGMLVADDVGMGKSRTAAGFVIDRIEKGKKRILVVTKDQQNVLNLMNSEFPQVYAGLADENGAFVSEVPQDFPAKRIFLSGENFPKIKKGEEAIPTFAEPTVYFVTASEFMHFAGPLKTLRADAVVIDEAHLFKNVGSTARGAAWADLHKDWIASDANILYLTATPGVDLADLRYLFGLKIWTMDGFDDWVKVITGQESPDAMKKKQAAKVVVDEWVVKVQEARERIATEDVNISTRYGGDRLGLRVGDFEIWKPTEKYNQNNYAGKWKDKEFIYSAPTETEAVILADLVTQKLKTLPADPSMNDLRNFFDDARGTFVDTFKPPGRETIQTVGMKDATDILSKAENGKWGKKGLGAFETTLPPAHTEQIMRELKVSGSYMARDISRAGVDFEPKEYKPPAEAKQAFNNRVKLYRRIHDAFSRFGKMNEGPKKHAAMFGINGDLQADAKRALFNMRLPGVIDEANASLARGEQVVISVVSVSEVDGETGSLISAIDKINVQKVEKIGKDTYSDPESIPEALVEVLTLKEDLQALPSLPSPIDVLRDTYGDRIAFVTGATPTKERIAAQRAFQRNEIDVIVISGAGKTGINLHDVSGKKRIHLIVGDYEWSATNFKQELGRVDRTGQRSSPKVTVMHTGSAGERKFVATISNRMKGLGATSKGGAESTGTSSMTDVFELGSAMDKIALNATWQDLPVELRRLFLDKYFRDPNVPDIPKMQLDTNNEALSKFLLGLQSIEIEEANKIMDAYLAKRTELLASGSEVDDSAARVAAATTGQIVRQVELGENLRLTEAKDAEGKKFAILDGVLTPHMNNVKGILTAGADVATRYLEGGNAWMRWVQFNDIEKNTHVSGLRVKPTKIKELTQYFGKFLDSSHKPETALTDLQAGDRIKIHGSSAAEWEVYLGRGGAREGKIVVDGAKIKDKDALMKNGAMYSAVGNFFYIPTDKLPDFFRRFPIRNDEAPTKPALYQDATPVLPNAEPKMPLGGYEQQANNIHHSEVLDDGWAQHVRPLLENMRDVAVDRIKNKPLDGAMRDLSPEGTQALRKYIGGVENDMSAVKRATMKWGESQRDYAMLNYNRRYGFDKYLDVVYPYQFFYTRSMLNWGARALDKPSWYAKYARIRRLQNQHEQDIPERLRNKFKINAPWLPDWMGDALYIDPLQSLFTPANFLRPFEQMSRDKNQQIIETERILQEWAADGQVSQDQITQAARTREGSLWERALSEAEVRRESQVNNPFDFFSTMFGPAWYLSTPLNMMGIEVPGISKGDRNKVSSTPLLNTSRAFQTVTQGTWAEPIGDLIGLIGKPEEWMRKKSGLPEFGEYGDYYVDRQLANMVADGMISPQQAQQAMIERQGDIFDQARERVKMELAMRVPLAGSAYALTHEGAGAAAQAFVPSLFGSGLLPAGELEYRGLSGEWNAAWKMYDAGDKEAINQFFEDHPEYEAYLAKGKAPAERLQSYLIGNIWDAYMSLGETDKRLARQQMGDDFQSAFLNKETRDYNSVDVSTLARWSQMLGGMIPRTEATMPAIEQPAPALDLYSPQVTTITDRFFNERKDKYGDYYFLERGYYAQPKSDRAKYLAKYPRLKQYWEWKHAYYKKYPEFEPIFSGKAFKQIDTSAWPPALEDYVTAYAMTGKKLPKGASASLQQVWMREGMPMGDFQSWLDSQVVPALMYQPGP